MYSLIRFFDEHDYLNQFLDGDLYMNSIGHFWKLGIEPQNDFLKGVGEVLCPQEFKNVYGVDLQTVFGNNIILPVQVRLETYKYVHLLCFMMHEYDIEHREVMKVDKRMKNMGKFAIRIKDVQTFVDRLFEKLKEKSQYGLMGPMKYHVPSEKSAYRDCFDKSSRYAHENEWRFALIPDYDKAKKLAEADFNGIIPYDKHITYSIDNLRDIAEEIDVDVSLILSWVLSIICIELTHACVVSVLSNIPVIRYLGERFGLLFDGTFRIQFWKSISRGM